MKNESDPIVIAPPHSKTLSRLVQRSLLRCLARAAVACSLPWLAVASFAQEADKEEGLPEPPYIAALPSRVEWNATVAYKTQPPEPKTPAEIREQQKQALWHPRLESITCYKDGKSLQFIYSYKGARKTEAYVINGIRYEPSSPRYPEDVVRFDPATDSAAPRYKESDFPELAWVGKETFVETVNEGGARCHFYQLTPEQMASKLPPEERAQLGASLDGIPTQMAWIEAKTRLPVKYDDGQKVMTYKYSASGKTVRPSPAFEKAIKAYSARK